MVSSEIAAGIPQQDSCPSPLLEVTLAQATCVMNDVSGWLNIIVSARRFYGFFVAQEEHIL
jgi:hypothetical protein